VSVSPFQWRECGISTATGFAIWSAQPSLGYGAVRDGPPAYRENRHWTMFLSQ